MIAMTLGLLLTLGQTIIPVRPGDTWSSLSLRIYGDTTYADTLRKLNGGSPRPRGGIRIAEVPAFAEVLLVVGNAWRSGGIPLQPGSRLKETDSLRLGDHARVELLLSDGSRVRVDGPALVNIRKLRRVDPFDLRAWFHLLRGQLELHLRRMTGLNKQVEVTTPSASGSIRGTWTALRARESTTWNMVYTGTVNLANRAGQVRVHQGEGTLAEADRPPLPPRPLPPPPVFTPFPHRMVLIGRSTAPFTLHWKGTRPDDRLHLHIQSTRHVLVDTLLPSSGSFTLPMPPGSFTVEIQSRDSTGLESLPIRIPLEVLRIH